MWQFLFFLAYSSEGYSRNIGSMENNESIKIKVSDPKETDSSIHGDFNEILQHHDVFQNQRDLAGILEK